MRIVPFLRPTVARYSRAGMKALGVRADGPDARMVPGVRGSQVGGVQRVVRKAVIVRAATATGRLAAGPGRLNRVT